MADDPQDPPTSLKRHPYVRRLLRQVAALTADYERLHQIELEMVRRDLLASRTLEPLNPAPLGVIEPKNGKPTILHVDNVRMMVNRVRGEDAPTIRIFVGGQDTAPLHAHWVQLGDSELAERPFPVPGRGGALVVLYTHQPITVLR